MPAICAAGRLAEGNQQQIQMILDCGILDNLKPLLEDQSEIIQRRACWIISNIATGTF